MFGRLKEFSSKKGLEYCPGLTPKMIADLKSTLLYPVRQAQHMAPPKNMFIRPQLTKTKNRISQLNFKDKNWSPTKKKILISSPINHLQA